MTDEIKISSHTIDQSIIVRVEFLHKPHPLRGFDTSATPSGRGVVFSIPSQLAPLEATVIEKYAETPSAAQNIKELKGNLASFKRLRVGNYRVIFDESGNIMFIYEIKHRQEAYND